MKVHVLQHASFEGLGNMEAWLRERDARISFSRLYESPVLPGIAEPGNIDLLIVLGVVLLLQGSLGVMDAVGIVYMRPVVLIPAAFVMLVGLVWAAIGGSKGQEEAASNSLG